MLKKKNECHLCGEIFNIPPYLIKPNPSLARTDFPDMSLLSLADSIKRYGILQPLTVKLSEKGKYELIAGERRLRAAMLLQLPTVPCILIDVPSDLECLSVVENLQREKLTMFDEARAIRRLYEKNGKDAAKTAKLLSMGESELKRKISLCSFSRAEMQAVTSLGLGESEAALFLKVSGKLRYYTIKLCAERGYSNSEIAALCRGISSVGSLSPDDLEPFADSFFKSKASVAEAPSEPTPCDTADKAPTVILKDLRSFEISLRKICAILENAGCRTKIRTRCEGIQTTYTVTVNPEIKND